LIIKKTIAAFKSHFDWHIIEMDKKIQITNVASSFLSC